ncbi:hypothetical protein [Massilia rubra]|uniref:Uncharacterized protein n=1 Tax=Massilia rubra TaxID=2607910 RepID=A0ABX0M279_9BURK|nr:hypothetical protein [Massilia rubra]NHZ38317.1 hypothetical protein [Massilia rubra]
MQQNHYELLADKPPSLNVRYDPMNAEFEAIETALIDYPPSGEDYFFIDMFVVGSVNVANVRDVLTLMSKHDELNRAFWSTVNGAPTSEEGWKSIIWIGSDMSDELQDRLRQRLRHTVEIVRAEIGVQQARRIALFRSKD